VLLSGHHEEIRRWRLREALGRTWQRRPELLAGRVLSTEEAKLLAQYQAQYQEKSLHESSQLPAQAGEQCGQTSKKEHQQWI
jgi:tRNA (guanine37-N1)-methyltransferase